MNWHSRVEVKKGDLGEDIFDKKLRDDGYVPYVPMIEGAHPIDRLYIHNDTYKIKLIDVKTKELRKKYPDTGFPLRNWKTYLEIDKNIEVSIFFVDYVKGEIYGNTLSELQKVAHIESGIVYFLYEGMNTVYALTDEEIEQIKAMSEKGVR